MKLELERRTLRLARPLETSYGEVRERELAVVALTDAEGCSGYGEAAPLPDYDGPDMETVLAALKRYERVLADGDGDDAVRVIDRCRSVADLPAALAAVEMALWDRAGKRAGKPLAELLTDTPAASVAVNATIFSLDRAGAAEEAAAAARAGFPCLKIKVGVQDDAGRVAAVRAAAGPEIALRLDANGAWDVEHAVRAIEALAPAGLELVEEPTHGIAAVREVRERVTARIAIDETAGERGALGAGVADAVCLKVSRCGGIGALLAAASLVRASGAEVYVASTLDGPLGVAAALHAASALASRGQLPPCGLATLAMFDGLEDSLPARGGEIALPAKPGLGVEPP